MEQMYAQALNLIDTLAHKMSLKGLTDFEYKLYERLCNAMTAYFGGLEYRFMSSTMECEKDFAVDQEKYLEWLAAEEAKKIEQERAERKKELEDNKETPEE